MKPIPYGRQEITPADIEAVTAALEHDYLTGGPRIQQFEQDFADYVGAPYAVAVSSGTAALHLCTLALEAGPGQTWLTTPLTFVASANCVLYTGAKVELVDIDPATLLIDLAALEAKLSSAPLGTYQGLVGVDFAGYPLNMVKLRALADEFNLKLIEDSCHAPGGWFEDEAGDLHRCGDGSLANLAIFSFHPVKHIAAGEGGMITTADETLYQRLVMLRSHGITRDRNLLQEDHGGWYYEMQALGFNYRLTDIQAALGISQLSRAAKNLEKRQALAKRYFEELSDTDLILPPHHPGHAYHLYVIQFPQGRDEAFAYLREKGILGQIHYIPLHFQPYYQTLGFQKGDYPEVEAYYGRCLSIPLFPSLSLEQQDYVIRELKELRS
ncbi:MAG: UDP-4-amino-4,6-dideoxy-N-acetyl-beta-L-altrosamine transaminase [Bacteroidota bacterium]